MKKILLFSLLLLSMGVFAESPYKHTIGFSAGSMNALSHKVLFNHFAVQTDAGCEITLFDGNTMGIFKINPMFMYQGTMYEDLYGNQINWFTGGGVSLGFMDSRLGDSSSNYIGGEFGLNAIAGIEFAFNRALALSLDFRPGYGLWFQEDAESFFDWGFQLGLHFYL